MGDSFKRSKESIATDNAAKGSFLWNERADAAQKCCQHEGHHWWAVNNVIVVLQVRRRQREFPARRAASWCIRIEHLFNRNHSHGMFHWQSR